MNGKERFASVVLLVTLAIGILTDVLDREGVDETILEDPGAERFPLCGQVHDDFRRLDINSATPEQLVILPGIGPKRANAIADWRKKNGKFSTLEDLLRVRGIGEKTLEHLRQYVRVDKGAAVENE
jgi:competence ComEA-like helix-hairpin-helix protein